ncbi:MAG TPA: hypothetical protein VH372_08840, partial [Actinospica sp.]|nr:hypothetical protein [Actinospica sp.]
MQQGGTWWRRGARGHAAAQAAGLLAPGDGWSAAAAELGLDDPEQINALLQVLEPHLGARPAQHPAWRRQVRALGRREHREACAALRALFEALGEAVPRAATSAAADGRPLLVGRENTVAAVNLVWAAVELLGERAIPTLGLILDRSLTEPWTLDSGRVRNACAGALAGLDTDESASVLISAAASAPTKGQKEQLLLCLDSAE